MTARCYNIVEPPDRWRDRAKSRRMRQDLADQRSTKRGDRSHSAAAEIGDRWETKPAVC